MSEKNKLPQVYQSTTRISIKRNRGSILRARGALFESNQQFADESTAESQLVVPPFFVRSQEMNHKWSINLNSRPTTSYAAVLAHSPVRRGSLPLEDSKDVASRSQTAPMPGLKPHKPSSVFSKSPQNNKSRLNPIRDAAPPADETKDEVKASKLQISPPRKPIKLPELGRSPYLVQLERSNRKIHGRLVELRSDHRIYREFAEKVHEEEVMQHKEVMAKLSVRDVVHEYAATIYQKFTPEVSQVCNRDRIEQHNQQALEVITRKHKIDTERVERIRTVIEDKWKRREEAREEARLAEIAAQHQQRMKVMLTTIALNARLFNMKDRVLRKRAVDKAYRHLYWSVRVIQRFFRNVYMRRRDGERLHAVLTLQRQMRWYLHDMRASREKSNTKVILNHLHDLEGASQVKELLANFMMRARRLQTSMHQISVKLCYRRAVLLAQWEAWEKKRLEEDEKTKKGRVSLKEDPSKASGSQKTKVDGTKGAVKPAKPKPPAQAPRLSIIQLDEEDKKKERKVAVKPKKVKEKFVSIPYSVKVFVVMRTMQQQRMSFVVAHREWVMAVEVFHYDWEENKFTYQAEMLKDTAGQSTPEDVEALKLSMTPTEPKWPVTASMEQLENMYQMALEALKSYVTPKEGQGTFLTQ